MHPVTSILQELVAIGSPTGFTDEAVAHVEARLQRSGIACRRTAKGALLAGLHPKPTLLVTAHLDTLGAMVAGLDGGVIRVAQLGGWPIPSFEGEYVTVLTQDGRRWRGTLLLDNPATHVNKKVGETVRTLANVHVRLDGDRPISSEADLRAMGLDVGDAVVFDPRFERTVTGWVRSRFLDDKAGCACAILAAERLGKRLSELPVAFFFSTYEEVGHGASGGLPPTIRELLAVDMGVIGDGCAGDERKVSVCAKDSSGPYDLGLRRELTRLAVERGIPHAVDIFPYYGSDGSAALRAGWDLRAALIGPGVSASHGVERSHEDALGATADLLTAFIEARG